MSQDELTPKQQWEELQKHILKQIQHVDKETPYSIIEPKWWLEMMRVQHAVVSSLEE